jgi:hypothetical protein
MDISLRFGGIGAKGASAFIGSLLVRTPESLYNVRRLGGKAGLFNLVSSDWMKVPHEHEGVLKAMDGGRVIVSVKQSVYVRDPVDVSVTFAVGSSRISLPTASVTCWGIAPDGLEVDGVLHRVTAEEKRRRQEDPRFNPFTIFE